MHQTMHRHQGMQGVSHAACVVCKHLACHNISQHEAHGPTPAERNRSARCAIALLQRDGKRASPAAVCLAFILSSTSWPLLSTGELSAILILLLREWHWKVPCRLCYFRLIACIIYTL